MSEPGFRATRVSSRKSPRLILSRDGKKLKKVAIRDKKVLLGRSDFADVVIEDPFVSKLHATILAYSDALVLLGGLAVAYGFQMWPALIAVCWWPFLTRQGIVAGLVAGLVAVTVTEPIGAQFMPWGRWPLTMHSAGWGIVFNLGLAIVDEQHRFGVAQREALGDRVPTFGARVPVGAGRETTQAVLLTSNPASAATSSPEISGSRLRVRMWSMFRAPLCGSVQSLATPSSISGA